MDGLTLEPIGLLAEDRPILDGGPLLDIKPYGEGLDLRIGTRDGLTEGPAATRFGAEASASTARRPAGAAPDGCRAWRRPRP